jgi:hypothetical protein
VGEPYSDRCWRSCLISTVRRSTAVYQHVLAWHEAIEHVGVELSVWRIHRRVGMSGGLLTSALLRETRLEITEELIDRLSDCTPKPMAGAPTKSGPYR